MTPEQRETLEQELERIQLALRAFPKAAGHYELAEALRAALAPPPTCGTCVRWDASGPYGGRRCLVYGGMRTRDDGCIKGYAPKEDR